MCGNGYNAAYGISSSNSSFENPETGTSVASSVAVGSTLPNNWGLYDTMGNGVEWCLDDATLLNLADAKDPFTPACNPSDEYFGARRRYRNGGHWEQGNTRLDFYASARTERPSDGAMKYLGFRIACIEK